jgi:hypothetical protein
MSDFHKPAFLTNGTELASKVTVIFSYFVQPLIIGLKKPKLFAIQKIKTSDEIFPSCEEQAGIG